MITFRFLPCAVEDQLEVAVHAIHEEHNGNDRHEEYLGSLEMSTLEWGRFYAAMMVGADRLHSEIKVVAINAQEAVQAVEEYLRVGKD